MKLPLSSGKRRLQVRGLSAGPFHAAAFFVELRRITVLYCSQKKDDGKLTTQATSVATKWLSGAGLRPTRQRLTLARLLVGDGQHRHVTAESLFAQAQVQEDTVSLATVYNTLRAFCAAGLVQEIIVDGSKSYFDTNTHDHPHF